MRFASTLLLFFGYLLIYAATAAGGKFATEPWAGLFADAYTESTSTSLKSQMEAALPKAPRPRPRPIPPGDIQVGKVVMRNPHLVPGAGTGPG